MDADGLPLVGSGIDLLRVPAIQQQRTVAFLNQFIAHTVRFLNRFSTVCEEKLASLTLRIQQIETTLNILEAKLSSIPGLEDVKVETTNQDESFANGPSSVTTSNQHQPAPPESQQNIESTTQSKVDSLAENAITVAKDPRYARYLKMVQVGVPVMAIRNKMISEGLNPDLLETPDAPVPDGVKEDEGDSSGSESSFSD
ncbi:WASH complex subunit 3 [Chiloscyllium plagiosum]|uniref:WASH complex subunit 3 n=1 Tax=Chiloscyllium plagiosum TaxID=36176 RepID=UPI001CB7C28B|nr:WASH complex subunit 3 [Chiloscyllium plagiosum]